MPLYAGQVRKNPTPPELRKKRTQPGCVFESASIEISAARRCESIRRRGDASRLTSETHEHTAGR